VSGSIRLLVATGAAFLSMISLTGCGTKSGEVIARVGDSAITKATLEHWLSVANSTAGPARSHDSSGYVPRQTILGFLLSAERTIGEAREDGIVVKPSEAYAALETIEFERSNGLSATPLPEPQNLLLDKAKRTADRAWIIRVNLLAEKVARRRLSQAELAISDAQIKTYYRTHKRDFVLPERRDVAVIQAFHKATADIAKREIESGRSLLSVVRRRNDEPDVGGLKRNLSRRGLRHAYEDNYFSAHPHVLVGPLKAEIYYLFEVTAVVPSRQQQIAEVQSAIRRKLVAGTQRQLLNDLLHGLDKRWRSRTRCRAAYLVAQCGGELT
jgi:hypothetical protein